MNLKLTLIVAGVTFLGLVAVAAVMVVRPTGAPDYTGPAPELADSGYVAYTSEVVVPVERSVLRAWITDNELVTFLRPSGSIPGVVDTTMLEGEWFTTTGKRRVNLEGGQSAVERIVATNDDRFFYQVWGFTTPARYLVDHAVGEMLYQVTGENETTLTWTYRMLPRTFFTRPLLEGFMANEFGPFMDQGLAAMAQAAEAEFAN